MKAVDILVRKIEKGTVNKGTEIFIFLVVYPVVGVGAEVIAQYFPKPVGCLGRRLPDIAFVPNLVLYRCRRSLWPARGR